MAYLKTIIQTIESNTFYANGIKILLTLILSLVVVNVGKKLINTAFNEQRKSTVEEQRRVHTLNRVSKTTLKTVVLALAFIEILSVFVDVKAILTVAGVGTIAIGIGAQAIVEDALSGFVILAENLFSVGEYIRLDGDHYGKVEKIGLRMTHIRQLDESLYIIHNGEITKLTNFSKGCVRAIVVVGIAYEENLEKVYQVLDALFDEMLRDSSFMYGKKPEIMGVEELADSAVMIRIETDVRAESKNKAERELRKRIKESFDLHQIEIPYNKCKIITDEDPGKAKNQ